MKIYGIISTEMVLRRGAASVHCKNAVLLFVKITETRYSLHETGAPYMNIALILSGGTGTRLQSDIPKQYIQIGNQPVISYCIKTLSAHEMVDGIHIVAEPEWQESIGNWLKEADPEGKLKGFSSPGKNRQLSILNGLKDIKSYAQKDDYLLIHDAARPMLSANQISACLSQVKGHDGLMPVLPMKDTVYMSKDGKQISGLLNRSEIYAGQAPEVFQLGSYYEANVRLLPDRILTINGSAEPAVLAGLDIIMIPGEESNFKITTKADLERFQNLVEESK